MPLTEGGPSRFSLPNQENPSQILPEANLI